MRKDRILNKVFLTGSSIVVLRALKNYLLGITGREVARISKLSPRTSIKTLTSLENLGLVNRIKGGRDHIFSLNRKNYLINKGVLPLLETELDYFESIKKDIKRKLFKKCISVIVFGSVARNEDDVNSDFDLCIITENGINRNYLENPVNELKIDASVKYGINISPFYITQKEFVKRLKGNKSPAQHIIKDGILVSGKSIKEIVNG